MLGAHAQQGCFECVVLSTCKGSDLASLLLDEGIAFVVAWSTDLEDSAGAAFAQAFYTSLQEQPAAFRLAFSAAVAELESRGYALVDPSDSALVGEGAPLPRDVQPR